MGYLENWLIGLATFLTLMIFLYSVFDIFRRLLSRLALRLCQMRKEREGGFICDLKNRLQGVAEKSLLPRVVMMTGSLGILVFIIIEHSPKL
jgi:uncharacterized membrane protein